MSSLSKLNKLATAIAALETAALPRVEQLAGALQLPVRPVDEAQPQLWVSEAEISLHVPELGKPFLIDFAGGKYDHRRKFGGGRGQPLARAVGLKQGQTPSIIDATAGFARDAFVLASLGCQVLMLEQNPIMSLLIEDALLRAGQLEAIGDIAGRMQIQHANAVTWLSETRIRADVIYLDPMYPSRDKSALVKKEMQLLHQLVGADMDSERLLATAREKAIKRVVVKRPKGADFVGDQKPAVSIQSKNTRFDIYPTG